MKKVIPLIALMFVSSAIAAPFEVESDTLLQGQTVSSFQVVDLNGDSRNDLVWLDSNGLLKVNYASNDALVTLENLSGTTWRLEYSRTNFKIVEFTNNGGLITTQSNAIYRINQLTQTAQNKIMFCTDATSGLEENRDDCEWIYRVEDTTQPNIMTGVDERTGDSWVAYKMIN